MSGFSYKTLVEPATPQEPPSYRGRKLKTGIIAQLCKRRRLGLSERNINGEASQSGIVCLVVTVPEVAMGCTVRAAQKCSTVAAFGDLHEGSCRVSSSESFDVCNEPASRLTENWSPETTLVVIERTCRSGPLSYDERRADLGASNDATDGEGEAPSTSGLKQGCWDRCAARLAHVDLPKLAPMDQPEALSLAKTFAKHLSMVRPSPTS